MTQPRSWQESSGQYHQITLWKQVNEEEKAALVRRNLQHEEEKLALIQLHEREMSDLITRNEELRMLNEDGEPEAEPEAEPEGEPEGEGEPAGEPGDECSCEPPPPEEEPAPPAVIITTDDNFIDVETDELIRTIFYSVLLGYAGMMFIGTMITFRQLSQVIRFIKYCGGDNQISKELQAQIITYYSVSLRALNISFIPEFDKYILRELLAYYQESKRKNIFFARSREEWEFSEDSHKILGYLFDKYTKDEIFDRTASLNSNVQLMRAVLKPGQIKQEEGDNSFLECFARRIGKKYPFLSFLKGTEDIFDEALDVKDVGTILMHWVKQHPHSQQICIVYNPQSIMVKLLLQGLCTWLGLLLYMRFFTTIFDKSNSGSEVMQMFIAVMATTIPMLEKLVEAKVKSVEAYMWARTIMTIIKGMLMITVFVANGLANDFFIGFSFFFTTMIGFVYFQLNPYKDPSVELLGGSKSMDMQEQNVFLLRVDAQKAAYSVALSAGFKVVGVLSILTFIGMIVFSVNSPSLPVAGLKIKVEGPFDVTSLSITAVIMILYNLFTWVSLVQDMRNGDQPEDGRDEMDRAMNLMNPLNMVCTISTTISNSTPDGEKDKEEDVVVMKEEDTSKVNKHNLEGTVLEVYKHHGYAYAADTSLLTLNVVVDSNADEGVYQFVGMDPDGITPIVRDLFVSFDFKQMTFNIINGNEECEFKEVPNMNKLNAKLAVDGGDELKTPDELKQQVIDQKQKLRNAKDLAQNMIVEANYSWFQVFCRKLKNCLCCKKSDGGSAFDSDSDQDDEGQGDDQPGESLAGDKKPKPPPKKKATVEDDTQFIYMMIAKGEQQADIYCRLHGKNKNVKILEQFGLGEKAKEVLGEQHETIMEDNNYKEMLKTSDGEFTKLEPEQIAKLSPVIRTGYMNRFVAQKNWEKLKDCESILDNQLEEFDVLRLAPLELERYNNKLTNESNKILEEMDEFTILSDKVVEHLGVVESRDYARRLKGEALRLFHQWEDDNDKLLDDDYIDQLPLKEKMIYKSFKHRASGKNILSFLGGVKNAPNITLGKGNEPTNNESVDQLLPNGDDANSQIEKETVVISQKQIEL